MSGRNNVARHRGALVAAMLGLTLAGAACSAPGAVSRKPLLARPQRDRRRPAARRR